MRSSQEIFKGLLRLGNCDLMLHTKEKALIECLKKQASQNCSNEFQSYVKAVKVCERLNEEAGSRFEEAHHIKPPSPY